jgi:hypothetical protein
LESQFPVVDNTPEEFAPAKRQAKDGGEYSKALRSSRLADAAQQRPDLEIFKEGRNPVMQPFCLLLLLVASNMIHLSLFS